MQTEYDSKSIEYLSNHLCSLVRPDEFIEIRTIAPKAVLHGAYNDETAIKSMVKKLSGKNQVYFSLNPRKMVSLNEGESLNSGIGRGNSYGAGSVSRICHFLIDVDRKKKKKDKNGNVIPATDHELKKSKEVSDQISALLISRKIDHAIFMSGNGYHIIIQTINYDAIETPPKFRKILEALNECYGTDDVEVDVTTHDAPRICKFYGTKSLKGKGEHSKKNRLSYHVSGGLKATDILSELNDFLKYNSSNKKDEVMQRKFFGHHLPLVEIFKKHGLYAREYSQGKHIVDCPFRSLHGSNSDGSSTTVIFDGNEGRFGFKCFHNSCRDITVSKVLDHLGERISSSSLGHPGENTQVGFSFKSLKEIFDEPDIEQEWLVEQVLIKGGLSILVGRPKSGKTTLARHLAHCVAHGERWLDIPTEQGTVLFIALEDKLSQLKKIYKDFNSNDSAPLYFHVERPPLLPIEKLKHEIIQRQASLVIIDTMLKFNHIKDASDYSETNEYLFSMSILARETNCHILVLHHSGKASDVSSDDDERSLLGSTAISGAADTIMFVSVKNKTRYFSTMQRYGTDIEKKVLMNDPLTGCLSLHNKDTFRINETIEKILDLLKDGEKERQFLEESLKMKGQDFSNILRDMVGQGLIEKRKEGRKDIYKAVIQIDSSPKREGGKK